MLKALLKLVKLFVTVPFFEFVGAASIVAGVWVIAGLGWALVALGVLALVKSLDLALAD